jgi:hypothetical protein
LKNTCSESVYFAWTKNELSLSGAGVAKLLKAVIERGKPFKFKARGWSMSPFIRDNDILTLSPPPKAFPQKGDVVGVVDPVTERLVVHRIVGLSNGRYRIKGDGAKNIEAESFGRDRICGRVIRVERNGKQVRFGLGPERSAIAVLSRVPALMWVASKAMNLKRKIKR